MTMLAESRGISVPLAPIALIAAIAGRVAARLRTRRALRDLAAMDDHILSDIGLSRADVVRASTADFGADRMAMLDSARARRIG